ncbi:MAG: YqjF family protein [Haloarculaceae archaeon]
MIDRARLRESVATLHMGWRHVLFANWPVDPAVVAPHVPDALTLDTHDGRAWLSVVPFTNVDVRPTWVPTGWGFPLPELNLRTYVRHAGRPGVYFFSLDAQGVLGVGGARLFHHLPYYYARIGLEESGETVRFESRRRHPGARPARFRGTYAPEGERFRAASDSLASFLTDRDRYFTEAPDGSLRYALVRHEPWPLFDASVTIDANTLFAANGFDRPETEPVFLYSPRVETRASPGRRA